MKINVDKEIFDYLINDLCLLFEQKGNIIDQNQVNIILPQSNILKEIIETKDLTDILCDIFSDENIDLNILFDKKKKKLIDDIEYLDAIVNTLNEEVDFLSTEMDELESKISNN